MPYVDYAATQPMRQAAIDAWVDAAGCLNSGAQYASGRKARSVLDDARETIAQLLGCEPIEVIFTASGTESNNIAVQGLYNAGSTNRIVSTDIEHPAVREVVSALGKRGADVDLLPVGSDGHVSDLSALDTPADVIACMWANNETGTLQPVREICEHAQGPVHVDAVQVIGKLPVNFSELGATTLAASAHKFGGPRGIGLLLAKRTPAPQPLMLGGGQQRGIRPGTIDVASAAGLAAALKESCAEMEAENKRLGALRDRLRDGVLGSIDDVAVHTQEPALSSHVQFSFPGTDSDSLLLLLDQQGIEASAGSACSAGVQRISHVLEAMGASDEVARGALRFTLGRDTTDEDVEFILDKLPDIVKRARLV
ncbi:Cysteine desulfurase family protein [Corynebacterium camporealensis]|uniref:Cysteine desulfurase family protein n=1 Tax=Corynebacterium camporealensis TaxID=161896 RepID=A0A0F6TB98_9CORY|nr:cysteine desulfurase family protein [Corynebacterium camporealensis]AKE38986.1 cysteine desulfurase family protein [Corynebacterium camporealensis]AVH88223.1 Cysteine desulfurase family protein [Corynebacterium camporealensis]MDY5839472.1 cysteine desulfurase family protein [Corynebacterium camporealensis]